MKKRFTKLLSLGLALAMLFTAVPVTATESLPVQEQTETVAEDVIPVQLLADSTEQTVTYKYVLDTDGIEPDGEYAIVYQGNGNRVLYCDEDTTDVFDGNVTGTLYFPQTNGSNFTLGTQIWKTVAVEGQVNQFRLQSTYEQQSHYYLDLTKDAPENGRANTPLHDSVENAPIVEITEGETDGIYKIQGVSGAGTNTFYLGYNSERQFCGAQEGVQVHFYKKTEANDISIMFDAAYDDNRWLFLGGEDVVGTFENIGSSRSFVGHFEEYIRATQDLKSINVKQRFMINSASAGRDLSTTVQNWDSLVPLNQPKAISYMISEEDYTKGAEGLTGFEDSLRSFIDKAIAVGFAVIQYPYKTADETVNTIIEQYIAKAEEVVESYASEKTKAQKITVVNHYEETGKLANWTSQYLTTSGKLNQKGHLKIGEQLAIATIGSSNDYPNSFAGSSLQTAIYDRPQVYSDQEPQVEAAADSLSVTLTQEIIEAHGDSYAYELTTTSDAGNTIVITDSVQVVADQAFVIDNLNQGDFWQLQMRTENGEVQLATVEGTVAEGETGKDHQPAAFTDRATEAQSALAAKLKNEEPMRWLFVGDSITHACKFTYGYDGISQLLDKYVKETLNRPQDVVINTAVWGAYLEDNLGENLTDRLDYEADVVVIMIGTNDSNDNAKFETYEADMERLLTEIETHNPGATIVIRTPLFVWQRNDWPQYANLVTMHDQLKTLAKETDDKGEPKVDFFVDQYSYTAKALLEDAWVRNGSVFLGDALHPTHLGQLLLFKELIRELGLEDNDSPMTDLMYDIKNTTLDQNSTDIKPYLSSDMAKKSITLDVNKLTSRVNDLRNVEFSVTHPVDGETRKRMAEREVTTDLTARTAALNWKENTKLEINGLEEEVAYQVKVKGWSISEAKEIELSATYTLGEAPSEETRTHEEAPEIAGYTLVWPENQTTQLDDTKLYLVVGVGNDGTAYALYGNSQGTGYGPGTLNGGDNGKITAKLSNLDGTPSAVWVKEPTTSLSLTSDLEFRLLAGSGENEGKYAFRSMSGYYLNMAGGMFNTSISYMGVQVGSDADANIRSSAGRTLYFNVSSEQTVNGKNNAHHTGCTNFWGPTSKPDVYNIYLYTRDGATVTTGADLRALQEEVTNAETANYKSEDYNANSFRLYEAALEEARALLEKGSSVPSSDQELVDTTRSKLAEAVLGLNRKPVYQVPATYDYILFTEEDSAIKVGDVFAIYSNNGNERASNRVLHSPGTEKTNKVQATLQQEGTILPLEVNNNINKNEQLWEVVSMEGDKVALRNVDSDGNRYLDLSRASNDNIFLSAEPKAVLLESVDATKGTFNIISNEESGYALNYEGSSFKTAEKSAPGAFRLFKQTARPLDIATNTHPTGTVSGQPMDPGTGGSANFRIPALITLSDGTIIGAADARWNHAMDFSAIDIIMVKSKDDGATWEYSFPIALSDTTNARHKNATTFIDPVLVRDKSDKIYLVSDLFPATTAYAYADYGPEKASGFVEIKGKKRMVLYTSSNPAHQTSENFAYYVGDHEEDGLKLAPIYEVFGENDYDDAPSFYMDKKFNLYDDKKQPMYCEQLNSDSDKVVQQNVFFHNSILHVRCAMYIYLITSEDGGNTWSDPMILNPQIRKEDGNNDFFGVGPGSGLWIDNGTKDGIVIIPTYSAQPQLAQFIYSEDGGITWNRSEDASTASNWSSESCLVQLDNTTIRHFYRSGTNYVQYTDHTLVDGKWKAGEVVSLTDIPKRGSNGCQISAIRYSKTIDGKPVILYSTPASTAGRNEGRIYVFTVDMEKEGKPLELVADYDITPGTEDVFAYSCITELEDGNIGILYEYAGSKITYKKLLMSEIAPEIKFDEGSGDIPPTGDDVTVPNGIWITGVEPKAYTGSKITQNFALYDGATLLKEKVDYTVSYKNNTKAMEWMSKDESGVAVLSTDTQLMMVDSHNVIIDSEMVGEKNMPAQNLMKSAPQMVITMKGNYTGKYIVYFEIEKVDLTKALEEGLLTADAVTAKEGAKTPTPAVYWKGKALKAKKDFSAKAVYTEGGSKDKAGEYTIKISGMNNFEGEIEVPYIVRTKDALKSLSKARVTILDKNNIYWQEDGVQIKEGNLKVMFGGVELKNDGSAYEVTYDNNHAVGTAYVIITGKGDYTGSKRVSFKIKGTDMKGVEVSLPQATYTYNGTAIEPMEGAVVKLGADTVLREDTDFTVTYKNNNKQGTATITLTGKPEAGYTGSKKVSFKINKGTLTNDMLVQVGDTTLSSFEDALEIPFTQGGAKPVVLLEAEDGRELTEGVDYTVKYSNNTKLNGSKVPTITIKGKGNYEGTISKHFKLIPKTADSNEISVVVNDKVVAKETVKDGWKSPIKVVDVSGKALAAKKDYDPKLVQYFVEESVSEKYPVDHELKREDVGVPAGTKIRVEVTLGGTNGHFTGKVTGVYDILAKDHDISKAQIKITPQEYTGDSIELTEEDITIAIKKLGKTDLVLDQDYKIAGYTNNVKKGTAKVTLEGMGDFGGTKTVSFKINRQDIEDHWEGLLEDLFGILTY